MLYFRLMTMLARCALTEPMWQRLKRQEGALLVIVVSSLFFMGASLERLLIQSALALATLSTLYFLNDLTDCIADQQNPRKDQPYITALVEHRKILWICLGAQKALILTASYLYGGAPLASTVTAAFLINAAYSWKLKGTPYLDVLWVGLWGSSIAAMAGIDQPIESLFIVAIMTAISHVYQVRLDASVDTAQNVQTSAVFSQVATEIQIIALCLMLGVVLFQINLAGLSLTVCVPWILGKYLKSGRAWVLARYYFGIIWLCYLESVYGRLAQL